MHIKLEGRNYLYHMHGTRVNSVNMKYRNYEIPKTLFFDLSLSLPVLPLPPPPNKLLPEHTHARTCVHTHLRRNTVITCAYQRHFLFFTKKRIGYLSSSPWCVVIFYYLHNSVIETYSPFRYLYKESWSSLLCKIVSEFSRIVLKFSGLTQCWKLWFHCILVYEHIMHMWYAKIR